MLSLGTLNIAVPLSSGCLGIIYYTLYTLVFISKKSGEIHVRNLFILVRSFENRSVTEIFQGKNDND